MFLRVPARVCVCAVSSDGILAGGLEGYREVSPPPERISTSHVRNNYMLPPNRSELPPLQAESVDAPPNKRGKITTAMI